VIGARSVELGWISREERERVATLLRSDGRVADMELELHAKDGRTIHCLYGGEIITLQGTTCLLSIALDITDRKQAEDELAARKATLAAITDAARNAIIMVDAEGRVSFWNPAAERVLGWSETEALGRELHELIAPERYRENYRKALPRFRNTGTGPAVGETLELAARRRDGTEIPVELSLSAAHYGGAWHAVGILRDISSRKAAEEELRQAEANYRAIYNSVNDAIFVHDLNGWRLIDVNDRACQMYGVSREVFLASTPERFMSYADGFGPEEASKLLERAAAGEPQTFEWQARRGDGTVFWVEVNLRRTTIGPADRILAVARDITDRRAAAEAIRRLNEELERRVEERTAELEATLRQMESFSYSISHDLRAPLRHVSGFSRIVLEDYGERLDEEGKNYLQRVCDGCARMGLLIDDLLTFSRLSRHPVQREPVETGTMVREVIDGLSGETAGRQVEFTVGDLPPAQADPVLLRQVFVNLIANAIKYSRPRETARIEVGSRREGASTVYHVRDNGVGFNITYAHKLFGVFQRLHRQEEFEGTGVGLAIVQNIVQRHGGRVWAEGSEGEGATFFFTLG